MFGKRGRRRKAQAATEHMGLAGIILIAVVILAYFVSEGTRTGGLQIEDAIGTIDNTVEGLSNIGAGSIETVIISSPKGVKSAEFISCEDLGDGELRCPAIQINYSDGRIDIFTMKYFVYGSLEFLKTPGIHRVTLYHDGTMGRVLFIECGDGDVNGWEECEWCDGNEDCATNTCINNICAPLCEIENDCNNLVFYSGS